MDSNLSFFALCLFLGILMVCCIAWFGSSFSRNLNISYSWFSIFSLALYIYIPYMMLERTGDHLLASLCSFSMAIFDSTIGWKICRAMDANIDQKTMEALEDAGTGFLITVMIVYAGLCYGVAVWLV